MLLNCICMCMYKYVCVTVHVHIHVYILPVEVSDKHGLLVLWHLPTWLLIGLEFFHTHTRQGGLRAFGYPHVPTSHFTVTQMKVTHTTTLNLLLGSWGAKLRSSQLGVKHFTISHIPILRCSRLVKTDINQQLYVFTIDLTYGICLSKTESVT